MTRVRLPHLKIRLVVLVALATGILAVTARIEMRRKNYSRARIEIADLQKDLEYFQYENGRYPTTEEGLGTLFNTDEMDPGFVRGMKGFPLPLDPWGNRYFYQSDGENYLLGSFGPYENEPDPSLLIVHSN
jgi:general secretion pathway protein G